MVIGNDLPILNFIYVKLTENKISQEVGDGCAYEFEQKLLSIVCLIIFLKTSTENPASFAAGFSKSFHEWNCHVLSVTGSLVPPIIA